MRTRNANQTEVLPSNWTPVVQRATEPTCELEPAIAAALAAHTFARAVAVGLAVTSHDVTRPMPVIR